MAEPARIIRESQKYNPGIVALRFLTTRINFVTGSDNILTLWRSKDLDAKVVTAFSLSWFFATPKNSMNIYETDDSGINPKPHPASIGIEVKNRYYYQNRKAIVGFFNGTGLKSMAGRFSLLLGREINNMDLGSEWIPCKDLYRFIQDLVIGPAVESMCGPVLLDQNPNFGNDLWQLDEDIYYFFKGYPKWLVPAAFQNRSKLLNGMKMWHRYARDNFDESSIESDDHDRFYGSPLIRARQEYLSNFNEMDDDALASQDLGLLWAENGNSIPAIFWMMYEALQRPDVLAKALEEVMASDYSSSLNSNPLINSEALCNMPFLQSMYAETLRLYTSLFTIRSATHGNFDIANFTIPRNEIIAVDSHVSGRDSRIWNTGSTESAGAGPHPLDQFWAERFLIFPNDPESGPLRAKSLRRGPSLSTSTPRNESGGPYFSLDGLAGAWTPYGGGNRQCPGRNFAKQEIILGFAIVFSMLDVELTGPNEEPVKPDMKFYGLGTLPPKAKVPFRLRRRV
ncbi:uncharacterized protein KY384_006958 [Bacidia gigantensis]|uniref:uncharacterized protein n=1 Tax=Bacidia gigantensis TaxID=2732470 RepID=UPI001D044896|nr:uncharacterized protein KY384_006958 [Bacidia gigantensis]KAG8528042.1 hypothetical protein KY384_006958 [Bacidia gigantensis]